MKKTSSLGASFKRHQRKKHFVFVFHALEGKVTSSSRTLIYEELQARLKRIDYGRL